MKNIFKLMSVALLASSMMVACGGDEEEKIPTPEQVVPAINVTFDETNWTSDRAMKFDAQTFGGEFSLYKDGSTVADAKFACGTEVGTYGFGSDDYWVVYWEGDEEYAEVANTGAAIITAIDMTAKTMTGTVASDLNESHHINIVLTNAKWN